MSHYLPSLSLRVLGTVNVDSTAELKPYSTLRILCLGFSGVYEDPVLG
jgi:hypothetical protein